MISHSRTMLIIFVVGFALAGLISVQIYWAYHAYHLTEKEFASDVKEAMNKTVADINTRLTCFEAFSKVRISGGEGIYMIKQKCNHDKFLSDAQNPPDTIPMFYDSGNEASFKWNNMMFIHPVNMNVVMQFQYILNEQDSANTFSNTFEKVTFRNFRDAFSKGKSIEQRYDPHLIDTLLRENLNSFSIDEHFHFGYIGTSDQGKSIFLYDNNDTLALQKSPFRMLLTPTKYFSRPYDLSVVFDNYTKVILTGILRLLVISVLIISILLVSFYLFVRIILKQRRLSELKNDFINNLTHEFKTPLTNISLAIENIAEKKISNGSAQESMLKIIGQEAERLRENVERILQIARFEKERLHLTIDQIDLHQLIQKTVSAFDSVFTGQQVAFSYRFQASQAIIDADEMHFFNVLYNLIDNGIKYNSGKPEIEITTKNFKKGILITVKDNGSGVPADQQKKIFEKFYRVTKGNLHDVKGYGLGLSYVKLVAESHLGYINVRSQPGQGSEFEVYIPHQHAR